MAHIDVVDPVVVVGARVGIGRYLGTVGRTGRTSACHLHFNPDACAIAMADPDAPFSS